MLASGAAVASDAPNPAAQQQPTPAPSAPTRTPAPTGDPLLQTRHRRPSFSTGTRVKISGRTGDWGHDNLGIVKCVASSPDEKGRYFVGVLPDGFRQCTGRPECKQLRHWADYEPGKAPLPAFEVGLLTPIEA
jgi:hypothetical protein